MESEDIELITKVKAYAACLPDDELLSELKTLREKSMSYREWYEQGHLAIAMSNEAMKRKLE